MILILLLDLFLGSRSSIIGCSMLDQKQSNDIGQPGKSWTHASMAFV